MKCTPAHLFAVALLSSCLGTPPEGAAVTPQRPTLSSDTSTTAQGTFELEAGLVADPNDSYDSPLLLKYGSGPRTEVFFGWSPLVYADRSGDDELGIGDVLLGFRHRYVEEDNHRPSRAVQGTLKIPTADEDDGLGTGELDFRLAGIATKSVQRVTYTGFYQFGLLGSTEVGDGADVGHDLALAASVPIERGIGMFGELACSLVPEEDFGAVLATGGGTYEFSPHLVLDAGLAVGLNSDAPDVQFLVGFTQNLGRPRVKFRAQ